MVAWTITESINLIIAVLSIIPAIILYKQYRRTIVLDYLIFSLAFVTVSSTLIWTIFSTIFKLLIFYQLHHISYFLTSYFFFLHGTRLRWKRTPKLIWYIGHGWLIIAVISILFFKIAAQTEYATVLFIQMPHGYSSYYPNGAGVNLTKDVILYSTSHNIFRVLYSLFAFFVMLYAYLTVEMAHKTPSISRSRNLWLVAIVNSIIYFTAILPWALAYIHFDVQIILSVALVIVAYSTLRIPEGMLMSHIQITRASFLYLKVQKMTSNEEKQSFGMESLVKYLHSLPKELMASRGITAEN